MPKRCLSLGLALILTSALYAQGNIAYPSEDYLGGGIGYTPTFLQLDLAKSFPFNIGADMSNTGLLSDSGLGFSADEINALGNLFVIHGAEGFGNVTGNWRVGAYVGLGAKSISRVETDTSTLARTNVDLKVALMTGSASLEYVIPLFSNLEISAGSLFGFSRAIIQFAKITTPPDWAEQFSGTDSSNTAVSLSGTFFVFQPYVAMKLQFLDRAGLRMTAGYQVGTLPANKWKLSDFREIIAPSKGDFNAPAVRVMLYLGI